MTLILPYAFDKFLLKKGHPGGAWPDNAAGGDMLPNIRFTELLSDIEPSATTKGNSSSAHTAVRSYLKSHPSFSSRWEYDFLAGSYARDTAIRPKKSGDSYERPDIDIIIVTSFTVDDHPDDVLKGLGQVLEDEFTVERINKRSVKLVTAKAEIDIVPVIEAGDIYYIVDRDLEGWKPTNPPGHTDWSSRQNVEFDKRFKPLVKLFKWWRRENRTGKRPKGFILEVLVSMHAPSDESHYGEAFARMLENIYSAYGDLADQDQKPFIEDPGLPGNNILSKVSITDWKNFIDRVRVHAGYARRAQDEEDMEEATKLWRKLFGDRFKTTAIAAKAENLASHAAAPAAAAGYTFPNTPVTSTKPRGFA